MLICPQKKQETVYYSSAAVFTTVKRALMTMAFEKWMTQVKSYYSEELLDVKFMMKRVAKSKWNVNANSFLSHL